MRARNLLVLLALAACETETETSSIEDNVVDTAATDVDLVHLGGSPQPIAVTAGATGAGGRLTSWKVNPSAAPVALADTPVLPGSDHQLHVLTPRLSPTLERQMLVSASVVAGTLVMRTWSVAANGVFTQLDTETYATVGVQHYTLGHRQILITPVIKKYQLVVPIKRATGAIRLATYEIDGNTGAITIRGDSGDLVVGAAPDPQLAVAYINGNKRLRPHYAVSFLNGIGRIENTAWSVNDGGVPVLGGDYASGKDIANAVGVIRTAASLANATLAQSGFVTVGDLAGSQHTDAATAEIQVWEDLTCAGPSCVVPLNLSDSSRDTTPAVPGVQQASVPAIVAPRGAARDPIYGLDMFTKAAGSKQSIASVRKVMVLMVMFDAIRAGTVSLDDDVVVSTAAGSIDGPSNMNLTPGEHMSLRDLAYGMMIDSAGDATWAISEHVAGTVANMILRMNARATLLGLADTVYCHDAADMSFSSVGYSTAHDQAQLWDAIYDDTEVMGFAGKASYTAHGTRSDGSAHVELMTKSMTWYLELDGVKDGAIGGSCAAYAALSQCSTCRSAQATRLDRPVVTSSLSAGASSVSADATAMFDWTFRQIFTPDYRGNSGVQGGSATDFGLAAVDDTYALTAVPKSSMAVELCNWQVSAGLGAMTRGFCTTHPIAGLVTSGVVATPRRVAIDELSELEAEADYIVGRITTGALKLFVWRVGQKDF